MKKQKTIYHLIVDKSGSMSDCIENTINGFNEQVDRIKRLEIEYPEQEITIGLTTFNHNIEDHYFQCPPQAVKPLTTKTYRTDGTTALLDAIGSSVQKIESDIARSGNFDNTTVVVVIITDGHENASCSFGLSEIRRTIGRLEESGKWTFSFIGATLDAVRVAESMNIKGRNSFMFQKSEMSSGVWDRLGHSMSNYMEKKKTGRKLDDLFGE